MIHVIYFIIVSNYSMKILTATYKFTFKVPHRLTNFLFDICTTTATFYQTPDFSISFNSLSLHTSARTPKSRNSICQNHNKVPQSIHFFSLKLYMYVKNTKLTLCTTTPNRDFPLVCKVDYNIRLNESINAFGTYIKPLFGPYSSKRQFHVYEKCDHFLLLKVFISSRCDGHKWNYWRSYRFALSIS